MADKRVEVRLGVDDRITREYKRVRNRIGNNNKQIRDSMKRMKKESSMTFNSMKRGISGIKLAFLGLGAVLTGLFARSVMKAGSEVEDLTVQFKVLLGSTEAAQKRMEELAKFAQTTPFQLEQVAQASRLLEVLTKGALSTGENLRMVGDAAAAAGTDFGELAMWVGRAYSGLQANRPIGEAMMRLTELGIVTGETRNQIEILQQRGEGTKAWQVLQGALSKSKGGMEALSKTVTGLSSTIKDQLNAAIRQGLDSGIWDVIRNKLSKLVEVLNKSLDDGTFERWGQKILSIGENVFAASKKIGSFVKGYADFILQITGTETQTANVGKDYLNNLEVLTDLLSKATELQALLNTEASTYDEITKSLAQRDLLAKQIESIRGVKTNFEQINQIVDVLENRFQELAGAPVTPREEALEEVTKWAEKMLAIHEGNAAAILEIEEMTYQKIAEVEKKFQSESVKDTLKLEDEKTRKKREKALEAAKRVQDELKIMRLSGTQAELESLRQEEEQKKLILEEAKQATVELETVYALRRKEINIKANEEIKQNALQTEKEIRDARLQTISSSLSAGMNFFSSMASLANTRAQSEIKSAQAAGKSEKQIEAIRKKSFQEQKRYQLFQALGNVALGVTRALASASPPLNFVLAGLTAAAGAIQIATIQAQKFAKGGFVTSGTTSGDNTIARVNKNEAILNTAQQRNFMALANGKAGRAGTTINFGEITINSSNGDPDEIAAAVNRTQQERIRELSDVLKEKDALLVT